MGLGIRIAGGAAALVLLGGGAFGGSQLVSLAEVGSGYKAKILCSEVFVAGRAEADVNASEFAGINPVLDYVRAQADPTKKEVRASLFGLGARRAVYRDGVGCTLTGGQAPEPFDLPARPRASGEWIPPSVLDGEVENDGRSIPGLEDILEAATASSSADYAGTRALVVIRDGRLVGESYAAGFSPETRFLSWSMAKSVTSALIGVLVGEGLIDPAAPASVPEWGKPGDPRAGITIEHLLHMSSGLAFSEEYDAPSSDVVTMLYRSSDMAAFAASKALAHDPGAVFAYSSGTTNILQRLMRASLSENGRSYLSFAHEALFDRIGVGSAMFEPDASGVQVGSSYLYATARDWARLGQLYLDDGVWAGQRVLPEGWVEYSRRPAPASKGDYGAHIWLNGDAEDPMFPGLPSDVFAFSGHDGQYVVIVPDKRLVIVRLGLTRTNALDAVRPVLRSIYEAA